FFQAEDGIRDFHVTGVQTCALPIFEKWFITWVRTAFRSKGNKSAIMSLLSWSEEIAKTNRETQKSFLLYCTDFFRQAMLTNYGRSEERRVGREWQLGWFVSVKKS